MGTQEQCQQEGGEDRDPDDLAAETKDLPQPGVQAILRISRPEWHWLLTGVLLMFVSLTCDLAKVLVYTSAIDKVTVSKNAVGDDESEDRAILPGFSPSSMLGNLPLTTLMVLHAVMEVLQHVFGQSASFLYELTGERSVARVRSDLLGAILSQEVGLFDRRKSGEFMSRLSTDVESLRSAVSTQLADFVYNVLKIICASCLAFFTLVEMSYCTVNDPECPGFTNTTLAEVEVEKVDKYLTQGLMGGSSLAFYLMLFWYSRKIAKVTAEYQDWVAKAAAMAQESIGSLRTVRSFAAEQHQVDGYTRLIGEPERPCGPCSPFGGGSALSVAVKRAF